MTNAKLPPKRSQTISFIPFSFPILAAAMEPVARVSQEDDQERSRGPSECRPWLESPRNGCLQLRAVSLILQIDPTRLEEAVSNPAERHRELFLQ